MTDQPAPPPAKRSSPLKWILLGCFGCLFLACLCAGGFTMVLRQTTQPAVDAFEKHVKTVAAGQVEQAYQETSSGFKANASPEQFQGWVNQNEALYAGTGFSFWNREVKAEGGGTPTGTISGTVSGPKGEVKVKVLLVFEDGGWRVHGLEPAQ